MTLTSEVAKRLYDPLGRTKGTFYFYDAHDNRTAIVAEDTGETAFTYDDLGNLLTLTDPEGNTTAWTYDALYRVIEEENELGDSRFFGAEKGVRLQYYDGSSNRAEKGDILLFLNALSRVREPG
jgi:YD repeat-containing protein